MPTARGRTILAEATISGSTSIDVSASVIRFGDTSLLETNTIVVTSHVAINCTASLDSAATVTPTATATKLSEAVLSNIPDLSTSASVVNSGAATLLETNAVFVAARVTANGTSSLDSAAAVTPAGTITRLSEAVLASLDELSASAHVVRSSGTTVNSHEAMVVSGLTLHSAEALVAGGCAVLVDATVGPNPAYIGNGFLSLEGTASTSILFNNFVVIASSTDLPLGIDLERERQIKYIVVSPDGETGICQITIKGHESPEYSLKADRNSLTMVPGPDGLPGVFRVAKKQSGTGEYHYFPEIPLSKLQEMQPPEPDAPILVAAKVGESGTSHIRTPKESTVRNMVPAPDGEKGITRVKIGEHR